VSSILSLLQDSISIYDLLDIENVSYATKEKPCQIKCAFHGEDRRPSARVYPDTNSVRCFYCNKSWDVITFWAEMNQFILPDGK
jgi:DNA primase